MPEIAAIIILLGAAQGIFFSLVLVASPDGNRAANRWLALMLSAFALPLFSRNRFGKC